MRKAGGEQAKFDLFAEAMGTYKTPASHRTMRFDDAMEATEVVQFADLLLQVAHPAVRRVHES